MGLSFEQAVKVSAEYTGKAAIQSAAKDLRGLSDTVEQTKKAIQGFVLYEVGKKIVEFGAHLIDMAEQVDKLSKKTGIGTQVLSDLRAAAEDNGIEFGSLESALSKFSATLGKAEAGSVAAQSGFKALGISLRDSNGEFKNSDKLLLEVADKFKDAQDGPAKAAIAVALFGRAGTELIPVLDKGSEAVKGLGVQMGGDFVENSHKFSVEIHSLAREFEGLGVSVLNKALPYLTQFTNYLSRVRFGVFGMSVLPKPPELPSEKPGNDGSKKKLDASGVVDAEAYHKEEVAVKGLREELAKLSQLDNLERNRINLTAAEYQKQKIAIEENEKAAKKIVDFKSAKEKKAYLDTADAIIKERQALIDFQEQQKQSFGAGAKEAFTSYSETIKDVASQSKTLFGDAFKGAEDSLVSFVTTGKLSFKSFADQIIADLARIAIRQAIMGPLLSLLGPAFGNIIPHANGGVMSSDGPVPLRKYASGGVASSPQLAMFGEGSSPEAFVPLPDGRSIPVKMNGSNQSDGGTNVSVSVYMSGSGDTTKASGPDQGKQLGTMIAASVKSIIINEKRPGGLLANA